MRCVTEADRVTSSRTERCTRFVLNRKFSFVIKIVNKLLSLLLETVDKNADFSINRYANIILMCIYHRLNTRKVINYNFLFALFLHSHK